MLIFISRQSAFFKELNYFSFQIKIKLIPTNLFSIIGTLIVNREITKELAL